MRFEVPVRQAQDAFRAQLVGANGPSRCRIEGAGARLEVDCSHGGSRSLKSRCVRASHYTPHDGALEPAGAHGVARALAGTEHVIAGSGRSYASMTQILQRFRAEPKAGRNTRYGSKPTSLGEFNRWLRLSSPFLGRHGRWQRRVMGGMAVRSGRLRGVWFPTTTNFRGTGGSCEMSISSFCSPHVVSQPLHRRCHSGFRLVRVLNVTALPQRPIRV